MGYRRRIYQAPNGAWSWSVFNRHQLPVASGTGCATRHEAEQEAAADERDVRLIMAGVLRDDGDPVTGFELIDLPEPPKDDLWGDNVP